MPQVFTSWSGGKDSCFACYLATISGLKVHCLVNMVTDDGKRSWTHGLPNELLQAQSQAISVPLVQRRTTMADYEAEFSQSGAEAVIASAERFIEKAMAILDIGK